MSQNAATMDKLLLRLRRFKSDYFALQQQRFFNPRSGTRWKPECSCSTASTM